MNYELKKKVPRSALSLTLWLLYITWLVYYFLYSGINDGTLTKEKFQLAIEHEKFSIFMWIASAFVFGYVADKIIPYKEVVWCKITESELLIYPNGPLLQKSTVQLSDLDQIRVVKEPILFSTDIHIFLKSGKYKVLRGYDKSEISTLIDFIKRSLPNFEIRSFLDDKSHTDN